MSDRTFENQSVIITGASSGIGWELAKQLSTQGAQLALAARRGDKLEELANLCRKTGGQALVIPTDVTDPIQCQMLIEKTAGTYGKIDMLINNAGTTMWARFDEITDLSIFEKIMRVNYLGSVYCTNYALSYLKHSRGRLVGISSLAGKAGVPTRTGYSASKHAMVGFFDSLRVELRGTGVSVTMVYPGFVDTGLQARSFGPDGKPLGRNPLQADKVMTAEECARLTLKAIASRRREEVMTLRGKLGQWLKLIAPGLVDRIASKAIEQGK
jgi:short-subunit dehydrogenase